MKIKFDTETLTETEARGLISLLQEVGGVDHPHVRMSAQLERKVGKAAEIAMPYGEPAPDGYPVKVSDEVAEVLERASVPAPPIDFPTTPEQIAANHAATVATTGDRDKDGILWDERIHSGSKATNKDGTWTRRRNIEDALYNSVMAELRGKNTARTMEAAAALVVPTPPPVAEPDAGAVFAVPTPPAAAVPTPPPTTQAVATEQAAQNAVAAASVPDFAALMMRVTGGQREGKLDPAGLKELLDQLGFDSIAKLVSATPDQRLAFDALLTGKLG